MREIKFRAWHKFSQQMYNVGYLHFAPNGELYGLLANETMQWGNLLAVKDFDLMQFTGLLDKHGKEIFEGDIIKYLDNTSKGLVEKTVLIEDIRHLPDFFCSKWEEVIGNIWENKDLLPEGIEA